MNITKSAFDKMIALQLASRISTEHILEIFPIVDWSKSGQNIIRPSQGTFEHLQVCKSVVWKFKELDFSLAEMPHYDLSADLQKKMYE